jgi:aminoglycoside/choline kinase family phosphotransferase
MDPRLQQLTAWANDALGLRDAEITPASSDASFRRYFRARLKDKSYVIMDAPPEQEDCGSFIKISAAMAGFGLHVPLVLEQDLAQGFLLLSDLGEQQYLPHLNDTTVDALYGDAIDALIKLQAQGEPDSDILPPYDEKLLSFEMSLMRDWFFDRHLDVSLTETQEAVLRETLEWLLQQALEQPRVWVHRDYHSRNLMLTEENNPGILDFQDAVIGPVTYDLVSLLKDCYITWPRERMEAWVEQYRQQAQAAGITGVEDSRQLLHWFDAMGAQRHIKVLGIFARLNIRDGKPAYLKDIPRVLAYVIDACERLPQLRPLLSLMNETAIPAMKRQGYLP